MSRAVFERLAAWEGFIFWERFLEWMRCGGTTLREGQWKALVLRCQLFERIREEFAMPFVPRKVFADTVAVAKLPVILGLSLVLTGALGMGRAAELPRLEKNGQVTQIMVDGKPVLMLSGELHNSSASSPAYMTEVWDRLAKLHLNTVVSTVSWELVEPQEGKFDFSSVDAQLKAAREHHLHLVLIWFGTWKNTASTYVPMWVKSDPERFPWRVQKDPNATQFMGIRFLSLSPFGKATVEADAKAYRMLMRHLRETDAEHTVLMMQVENETGFLGESRDYSPGAEAAWKAEVPAELMTYLKAHKAALLPEITEVWGRKGFREKGTWAEVFGEDDYANEVFMAWAIGGYVGKVAKAGAEELALPMYANAWLVQDPKQLPGGYPSGGPVSRVMDVWRAAAPTLSFVSPDIYIDDFEGTVASFTRSGNPLFIPEARVIPGNMMWAVAHHAALGVSPFGIDDVAAGDPLGDLYGQLSGVMPLLLKAQTKGEVSGIPPGTEGEETVAFGNYSVAVRYGSFGSFGFPVPEKQVRGAAALAAEKAAKASDAPPPAPVNFGLKPITGGARGYGMLIAAGPDEFYAIGTGVSLTLHEKSQGVRPALIGELEEGSFVDGKWVAGRRLNGDEGSFDLHTISLPPGALSIRRIKMYR